MIDRLQPTHRPPDRVQGLQQWRNLLFLHWIVPIEVLRPLVPRSLELDLHDGIAYVGIVPFAMQDVRPIWCPRHVAFSFLETNVRTYVHAQGRPGVYFFSLDAASAIAVWVARTCWSLPYYYARMTLAQIGDDTHYRVDRPRSGSSPPAQHEVRYRVGEALPPATPGSLEFFLLERYLLFVERQGTLQVGQVHHVPYPAHGAAVVDLRDSLLDVAGIGNLQRPPDLVHYSPGVNVEIFPLKSARAAQIRLSSSGDDRIR